MDLHLKRVEDEGRQVLAIVDMDTGQIIPRQVGEVSVTVRPNGLLQASVAFVFDSDRSDLWSLYKPPTTDRG